LHSAFSFYLGSFQAMIIFFEAKFDRDGAVVAKASLLGIDAERAPHDHAIQPLTAVLGAFIVGAAVQALADVHLGQDPLIEILLGQGFEPAPFGAWLPNALCH
jgi:hypothetical protein